MKQRVDYTPKQFGGSSKDKEKVSLIVDYGPTDSDYIRLNMRWEVAEELYDVLGGLLGKGEKNV
jgi:hypothetical protein